MDLLGITLGLTVALLWGLADSIATVAARRLGAQHMTVLSQSSGLFSLTVFTLLNSWLWPSFTPSILGLAAFLGAFTGLCAALGYYALYQGLKKGPIALVSPITSSSAIVTLILALALLHDRISPGEGVAIVIVLVGIILASTNLSELNLLSKQTSGFALKSSGIGAALLATIAFGAMDFGIGASAQTTGFFLPVMFTRAFSVLFLLTLFTWRESQAQPRLTYRSARLWRQHLQQANRKQDEESTWPTNLVGIALAIGAGVIDNAASLVFCLDTRIANTGITAAIASNYSVICVLIGFIAFRERLTGNQLLGIGLVLCGLTCLALIPL